MVGSLGGVVVKKEGGEAGVAVDRVVKMRTSAMSASRRIGDESMLVRRLPSRPSIGHLAMVRALGPPRQTLRSLLALCRPLYGRVKLRLNPSPGAIAKRATCTPFSTIVLCVRSSTVLLAWVQEER